MHGHQLETVTPQEIKGFVTPASIPNIHLTIGVSPNQVSITLTSKYCGKYGFWVINLPSCIKVIKIFGGEKKQRNDENNVNTSFAHALWHCKGFLYCSCNKNYFMTQDMIFENNIALVVCQIVIRFHTMCPWLLLTNSLCPEFGQDLWCKKLKCQMEHQTEVIARPGVFMDQNADESHTWLKYYTRTKLDQYTGLLISLSALWED